MMIEPLQDHDAEKAAAVCAEIARRGLEDFAPALVLLSPAERRRVQALAAFGLTLFDFARQSSLEGEKLAQINRWSFDLESTLAGSPPGQPVFVLLAVTHAQEPWPEEALLELANRARRRALRPRAGSVAEVERDARRLAVGLTAALVPEAADAVVDGLATLLRVRRLLRLGEDRRRHQAGLARDELPEDWERGPTSERELALAVRQECARLAAALDDAGWLTTLPRRWRHAAGYAVLGARKLVQRCDALGEGALDAPPCLGAGERLALLLRARWARV